MREYQEFAQKLIDESFTSESVARRGLREDPDFFGHVLSSIGMKIGQRSCITRYLDPPLLLLLLLLLRVVVVQRRRLQIQRLLRSPI